MSFTPEQTDALTAPLSMSHVKSREQGGRSFSYVESWWAESEANRIFGFDGWDSETVNFQMVAERARKIGSGQNQRDGWGVSYIAKVRVTVCAGDRVVVREGCGAGHGIDADLGLAHESALKEAESDAEKRALKTFGNPFGLALYDKSQANVVKDGPPAPKAAPAPSSGTIASAKPAPIAIGQRADILADAMKACANRLELKATWDRGAKLCADLDAHDPERLAELTALHTKLDAELPERIAA